MSETLLQYFPGPQDKIYALLESMRSFIARRVRCNAQSLEPSNPRDFIDCFLLQMEKVGLGGGWGGVRVWGWGVVCFASLCFVLRASLCMHAPRFAPAIPPLICMHRFACTLWDLLLHPHFACSPCSLLRASLCMHPPSFAPAL